MKPIKLVMNAFGPYKERIEIDFEKLGNNGIFLITGDTGSGKTTIFDSISFALFGVSSGSRRENNSLRSDFASDKDKTFVEFDFFHKGIFYKISRTPRYTRNKVRGNGVTSVGGDATLNYLDEVVTGDKNVTDKCIEILGINANQFKQIVMIAQGEFMELLLAKPKDRAIIFRKIFDTGIYKDISDKLKNEYLLKKREYEDLIITLDSYKNNVIWDKDVNYDISIEMLLDLLEQCNIELKAKEEILVLENKKIEKEYEEVVKKLNDANLINDSIVLLNNTKIELEKLMNVKSLYDEKEICLNKNKMIIDNIIPKRNEVNNIKKTLLEKEKEYNTNLCLKSQCDKKYKKVEKEYSKVSELNVELQNLKENIRKYKDNLQQLESKEKVEVRVQNLKNLLCLIELKERKDILNKFKDLDFFVKELEEKEIEFKEITLKYEKDNEFYVKSYEEFLNSQAGIIALKLEDNCPCPVCGSLVHPKKAVVKTSILTREELDDLKFLLEDTSKRMEELVNIIKELKDKIYVYKDELEKYNYEKLIDEIASFEKKLLDVIIEANPNEYNKSDIEREIIGWEEYIKENFNDVNFYESEQEIIENINDTQFKIEELEVRLQNIVSEYQENFIEREKYNVLVEKLKKEIDKKNYEYSICNDEYILAYNNLGYMKEDEYLSIMLDKDLISDMEKDVSDYKIKLVEVNSTIKSLNKFLDGKEKVDILELQNKRNELEDKRHEKNVALKEIDRKLFNNLSIYNNIKSVFDKLLNLEKEVMLYKDLSDTANGNINGKNKLEFEQYVQANYFDMVIISANKRFSYMTDERFLLSRKEESLKISDKLGLELEVIDNYTGKRRDVRTLSGGESFKAALSLALGMSDVIQEFSGGIVVDAMFIDEGFGSLDDTSLETAMNAIMILSSGGKMIGIISHVNELKNRIDKKIVVKKSNIGSTVEIIV